MRTSKKNFSENKMHMYVITIFLANDYNITWKVDGSANYKFFHKYNSIVIPSHQDDTEPFRYPFADVFIYAYDEEHDILAYTNKWKDLVPGVGFIPSSIWPKGTILTTFGDFEMRISIENEKYLESLFSSNWDEVGVTQWYDHYNNFAQGTTAFKIPEALHCPARPFSLPLNMRDFRCKEIT